MILFVNACVREDSRTKQLAEYLLLKLDDEFAEIRLSEVDFPSQNESFLLRRDQLVKDKCFDDPIFDLAKDFAAAKKIVIAAPYWDLSFPALLKCYIEQINVIGLTFAYNDAGKPYGLCKADELIYVTTSGGAISDKDWGFGYIKSLAHNFYGIKNVSYFKAENLDLIGADVESILQRTKMEIDRNFA